MKVASGMYAGESFRWTVCRDVMEKSSASQVYLPVLGIAGMYDGNIR